MGIFILLIGRRHQAGWFSLCLLLLVYNLWVLFVRFIVPHKHTEAKCGRRWFLLIAARLVQSGRQKEVQISIRGGWAEQLRDGYFAPPRLDQDKCAAVETRRVFVRTGHRLTEPLSR
jgi:hypothetical protein